MSGDDAAVAWVLLRYGSSLDDRQWERLATCFVPEVEWSFGVAEVSQGREPLVAMCRAAIETYDATQHMITNREVEVDGDTARLRANLIATHLLGEQRFVVGGVYREGLLRTAAGWRISSHRLDILWTDDTGQPASPAR